MQGLGLFTSMVIDFEKICFKPKEEVQISTNKCNSLIQSLNILST